MLHRALPVILAAALLAACSNSSYSPPGTPLVPPDKQPKFGAFGLDLAAQDTSVKPGDDFFQYANGHWMATTRIPADRTRWGTFDQLATTAEAQVREIVESLGKAGEGSAGQSEVERKVGEFYRAYLDTDAIEKAGLAPAQPGLDAISGAKTHAQIAALIGRPDMPVESPVGVSITTDQKNPDRYIVDISQGGLGLPEREYYLGSDPALKDIRDKYVAHIERFLGLAKEADAGAKAKQILDVETRIAKLHWPIAKRRELDLTYNLRTRQQLDSLSPGFPWDDMLKSAGLDGQKEFVVRELDAVQGLEKLFRQVPVATWQTYLKYHYLINVADVLPKAFDDERFAFYGHTLNGQPQQRERWKRGIASLNVALGEAVGQLYVQKHFPPESKEKMTALVENLRVAYAQRIRSLPWMSEDTKKVAREKLETFRPKIGYPDKWRDYSALEIKAGDAFGNKLRAAEFEWNRQASRINQPTDRGEWFMTPQTVNAYYEPTFNEIVFPAAILQPPFFDPNADDAVNYGAIGGVIGHEMGHGFDDQGSKSDAKGILRTWWKPEDEKAFKSLVDGLATQYDGYEALPGLKLNGRLTLGENIGDLGGLTVAHEAYELALSGSMPPVLGGLTGDQRFFLSWAQCWRSLIRDETLRNQVMSDPHSPARFRVNGVVRNLDLWYSAFNVQPGDKLYLEPEKRVKIW